MRQSWTIAITTVVATLVISVFIYYLPQIEQTLSGSRSETYVFLLEYDYSNIHNLTDAKGVNAIIMPIKVPKLLKNTEVLYRVPLSGINLTEEVENKTIFAFYAQNKGKEPSKNIMLDIDFAPFTFLLEPFNKERVTIRQGGKEGSTRVKFSIENLYPDETQGAFIYTRGNQVKQFSGWTEDEKQISNLFYYKIVFEEIK